MAYTAIYDNLLSTYGRTRRDVAAMSAQNLTRFFGVDAPGSVVDLFCRPSP